MNDLLTFMVIGFGLGFFIALWLAWHVWVYLPKRDDHSVHQALREIVPPFLARHGKRALIFSLQHQSHTPEGEYTPHVEICEYPITYNMIEQGKDFNQWYTETMGADWPGTDGEKST